jgi:FkbM family methyltransferase
MASLVAMLRRGIESLGHEPQTFPPVRAARWTARSAGVEMEPFGPRCQAWQLRRVCGDLRIDTLLDIGANRGQFGVSMRDLGFRGTIHSFEPVPEVHAALLRTSARDKAWHAHAIALGGEAGRAHFNVGELDQTSSLKAVAPGEGLAGSVLKVARRIEVEVSTVDRFVAASGVDPCRLLMKIDVQGAELEVLDGSRETMAGIGALLCETSLERSYEGESSLCDLLRIASGYGLGVRNISPVYFHPERGSIMQLDVLCARS